MFQTYAGHGCHRNRITFHFENGRMKDISLALNEIKPRFSARILKEFLNGDRGFAH